MNDDDSQEYDQLFKILLLGDTGTGKSSLILRYTDNTFNGALVSSIGVDFKVSKKEIDGKKIKIQIWDTAGHERFRALTTSYYRGANAILIVYDLTDRGSFDHVNEWLNQIDRNANSNVLKFLVGNKLDLENERVISKEEATKYAKDKELPYLETSAKNGENATQVFELALQTFLAKTMIYTQNSHLKLETPGGGNNCCC